MKALLFLTTLILTGCSAHKPMQQPPPTADSITLVSVTPVSGTKLDRGGPVRFDVTLNYTLATRRHAMLSLSLAQYRNPDSCTVALGEFVEADEVELKRGSGTLHLPITWPGDTGVRSKGRIFNYGSISFSSSFWEAHLVNRFGTVNFAEQYCSHF